MLITKTGGIGVPIVDLIVHSLPTSQLKDKLLASPVEKRLIPEAASGGIVGLIAQCRPILTQSHSGKQNPGSPERATGFRTTNGRGKFSDSPKRIEVHEVLGVRRGPGNFIEYQRATARLRRFARCWKRGIEGQRGIERPNALNAPEPGEPGIARVRPGFEVDKVQIDRRRGKVRFREQAEELGVPVEPVIVPVHVVPRIEGADPYIRRTWELQVVPDQ